ncbi:hypothetical protein [Peptoanaerobacter stomatis]
MLITGSYVSIDLDTKKLKIYYGEKSYNKAYYVLKKYMTGKSFEHIKDTNYVNANINVLDTYKILSEFAKNNEWFPLSLNKANIMPVQKTWDLTQVLIEENINLDFKKKKEQEYKQNLMKDKTDIQNIDPLENYLNSNINDALKYLQQPKPIENIEDLDLER